MSKNAVFKTSIRGTVSDALERARRLAREADELKALSEKKDFYSAGKLQEFLSASVETRKQAEEIMRTAEAEVNRIVTAKIEDIRLSDSMKGEELTPDSVLLTGNIPLKASDLRAIQKRSEGNPTMLMMVSRYAEDHNMVDRTTGTNKDLLYASPVQILANNVGQLSSSFKYLARNYDNHGGETIYDAMFGQSLDELLPDEE